MTLKVQAVRVLLACALGGCADDKGSQTGPASSTAGTDDPSGAPTGDAPTGTGDDPTGGLPSMEVCEQYLDCIAKVAPGGLPTAQQGFGPDGTCWQGSIETAEQCLEACQAGLDQWNEAFPDEPKCGPAGMGIDDGVSGLYLLAVATTLDSGKPLQFLATFSVDASSLLNLSLQPLTLGQGKVTTPRQPLGPPVEATGIPVVDGQFAVDLGTVTLPGPTNPITGAELVTELALAAQIVDMDFICGAVSGALKPPFVDLAGSTFAAVRVEGPDLLPANVVINCDGTAVTDP